MEALIGGTHALLMTGLFVEWKSYFRPLIGAELHLGIGAVEDGAHEVHGVL